MKLLFSTVFSATWLAGLNQLALAQLAAHGHLTPRLLQSLTGPANATAAAASGSGSGSGSGSAMTTTTPCRPGPRQALAACCA